MAHEFFIAKRIFVKQTEGKKVSRPIVRISTISIALAIVVNLLTIGVVIGFQKEVREKVSGFSSHAMILNARSQDLLEGDPMRDNATILEGLSKDGTILSASKVGFKPVLFQSEKNERKIQKADGTDTTIVEQNIDGALIKGVEQSYDWSFIESNMLEGRLPDFTGVEPSDEILISKALAGRLQYHLGDTVNAFFVKNRPIKRLFHVVGIYQTGLEEFDRKTVFGDLRQVQELSDWGLKAQIEVLDTLSDGYLIIKADVEGGNGFYEYDWGKGFGQSIGLKICPTDDTNFRLITREKPEFLSANDLAQSIPDTAYIDIQVDGAVYAPCNVNMDAFGALDKTYLGPLSDTMLLTTPEKEMRIHIKNGIGNSKEYIGGLEIKFKDWDLVPQQVDSLKRAITFVPTEFGEQLKVMSIQEDQEEIFVWLEFLDLNVLIILILMILIGIVNVGAALMVLILVKTPFIGLMKGLGASNWPIRKIFLIQAGILIGKGMLWGNVIGLSICLIQKYTGILQLNPEVYYLSKVPIEIGVTEVVLLNLITIVVCLSAMIAPSNIISRILPAKSIRFE